MRIRWTQFIDNSLLACLRRLVNVLFGDGACLALAQQLDLPAITVDRIWEGVIPDVVVQVIR